GDGEIARAPGLVARLLDEGAPARLDAAGETVEVLDGRAVDPEALALHAAPAFLPVVLGEREDHAAGGHLDPGELPVLHPAVLDDAAHHVAVPGQALLDVVHGEGGRYRAEPQRLGLLAGAMPGPGRALLRRRLRGSLRLRCHRPCLQFFRRQTIPVALRRATRVAVDS